MIKIHLENYDKSKYFIFPVTPEEIKIATTRKSEKYRTVTNGDLLLVGQNDLKTISFSGFFPAQSTLHNLLERVSMGYGTLGVDCANIISAMRDERKPLRIVITGMNINMQVIIDKFDYSAVKGKDVDYSISFIEYRGVKTIDN